MLLDSNGCGTSVLAWVSLALLATALLLSTALFLLHRQSRAFRAWVRNDHADSLSLVLARAKTHQ